MKYKIHSTGEAQNGLFADMLAQNHLLIGGATGSGKSVLENDLIYTALLDATNKFILIDPKKIELYRYKNLPQVLFYADEINGTIQALQFAIDEMERRYIKMRKYNELKYTKNPIYIFIDELADLMTTNKKQVAPMLQRLLQLARASNIHLIVCTQKPTNQVIPTELTVNIVGRVGLATRNARESINIINFTGCENIDCKGIGYYTNESNRKPLKVAIEYIKQDRIDQLIKHYEAQKPKSLFYRIFHK